MPRKTYTGLGIAGFLLLAALTFAYTRGESALGLLTHRIAKVTDRLSLTHAEQPSAGKDAEPAPEFAPGIWINSEPLTLKGLRGRVVLVDFWTFACYNCRNTLPHLKDWDARYRDKGLTIVGVHSPELDEERVIANVRHETASLGIHYPVVTDNDYTTWRSYNVDAWPTVFLLDKQGRIRWTHVGEGAYAEAESKIQDLLAE